MEPIKIVVRYTDGRVFKGYTQDFFPNKSLFHLYPHDRAPLKEGMEILVKDLKAVFFVRDFGGNSAYEERKNFLQGENPAGRILEVIFKDGEILVGSTLGYDAKRMGFFCFPADPQSNNMRIFVASHAVRQVQFF